MNNEIPENENSPEIIEVDLPPAIKTPVPALEPFEVMYKHGNEKPIIDTLVPPPNPIMLDGIWKKQPSRTYIAALVSYGMPALAKTSESFHRLVKRFQR